MSSPGISLRKIGPILEEIRRRLNAQSAHIEVTFPYFIDKEAPGHQGPGPDGVWLQV